MATAAELALLFRATGVEATRAQMGALAKGIKDTEKTSRDAGRAADGLGKSFGKLSAIDVAGKLAAVLGIGALVGEMARAVKAASDLEESQNKVAVVFGESAQAIREFARSAAESLGQSEQQATEAAGTFGNLFVSMGIGQAKAADMSVSLVTLAADLASFNNIDPTVALEKLRSGLVGESEPLRTLGVNLDAAGIKAEAMRLGIAGSSGELTAAQKAQAAYSLILQQTQTAQGDFARTSDGLANSQRQVQAAFRDIEAEIGRNLLPAIASVTPGVKEMVFEFRDGLRILPETVARISALVQIEFVSLKAGVTGIVGEMIAEVIEKWAALERAIARIRGLGTWNQRAPGNGLIPNPAGGFDIDPNFQQHGQVDLSGGSNPAGAFRNNLENNIATIRADTQRIIDETNAQLDELGKRGTGGAGIPPPSFRPTGGTGGSTAPSIREEAGATAELVTQQVNAQLAYDSWRESMQASLEAGTISVGELGDAYGAMGKTAAEASAEVLRMLGEINRKTQQATRDAAALAETQRKQWLQFGADMVAGAFRAGEIASRNASAQLEHLVDQAEALGRRIKLDAAGIWHGEFEQGPTAQEREDKAWADMFGGTRAELDDVARAGLAQMEAAHERVRAVQAGFNAASGFGGQVLDQVREAIALARFSGQLVTTGFVMRQIFNLSEGALSSSGMKTNSLLAAMAGLGSEFGFTSGQLRDFLPSFDRGGTIPGSMGSPQVVLAHGGETVSTPGQVGRLEALLGELVALTRQGQTIVMSEREVGRTLNAGSMQRARVLARAGA